MHAEQARPKSLLLPVHFYFLTGRFFLSEKASHMFSKKRTKKDPSDTVAFWGNPYRVVRENRSY